MPIIYVHGDSKKAQEWHGNWACANCNCRWKAIPGDAMPALNTVFSDVNPDNNIWLTPCPHCGEDVIKIGSLRSAEDVS